MLWCCDVVMFKYICNAVKFNRIQPWWSWWRTMVSYWLPCVYHVWEGKSHLCRSCMTTTLIFSRNPSLTHTRSTRASLTPAPPEPHSHSLAPSSSSRPQGPFEHHSNLLPWRESCAKVVHIRESAISHRLDQDHLKSGQKTDSVPSTDTPTHNGYTTLVPIPKPYSMVPYCNAYISQIQFSEPISVLHPSPPSSPHSLPSPRACKVSFVPPPYR